MGARETALSALIACRKNGAWPNGVLKEYISRDHLDSRDGALATRLCYGVLQNRSKLDFYLSQLLRGKIKNLHPAARDILHLGLYQLYEMDRIPESAAVNESVALVKKYCPRQPALKGLVNGVLRSAVREKDNLKQPQSYEDRYSHPEKLIKLLKGSLPKGTLEPMLIADNQAPDMTVQVNTVKITARELTEILESEHVTVRPHPWMPDCLVLSGTGSIEELPSFRQGLYYVQDPAAKLAVLCAELPEDRELQILDCCAAPGGKSFASAVATGGRSRIFACDIYPHKAELIAKGAARLGFDRIETFVCSAAEPREDWKGTMDAVIADVPCSGYGIIRKKPDIRYKDPDEMKDLPRLQLAILSNQADYVKPGGVLMYSTCTVLKRENEEVVKAFLESDSRFTLEPLPMPAPFPENTSGMLTLIPGQYDTDGFFICRLRRNV